MRTWLSPSPILIKEMRSTMRGRRAFVGITFFLVLLMIIALLMYYMISQQPFTPNAAEAGRALFAVLLGLEIAILAVMTPALTASAVAGEKQQKTFDMLMATPLSPFQVLRGKLLASMNFVILLIFASLPINSIAFLFGGVTPSDLLAGFALMVSVLLFLGCLGLMWSTLMKSSGAATAMSFLSALFLFGALPAGLGMAIFVGGRLNPDACHAGVFIFLLHPLTSLISIFATDFPMSAGELLPASLPLLLAGGGLFFLAAERRLAATIGQSRRRVIGVALLVGVIVLASGYLALEAANGDWC